MEADRPRSDQRILDAARSEFATFGYAGARTQRIAQRAGVNKQLLFYYFGSKRGLYDTVLRQAGERIAAERTAASHAPEALAPEAIRERLQRILATTLPNVETVRLLIAGAQAADAQGPGRAMLDDLVEQLRSVISAGQGIGYFRDAADPALAARQLAALAVGQLALEPGHEQHARGHAAGQRWAAEAVELFVRALRW